MTVQKNRKNCAISDNIANPLIQIYYIDSILIIYLKTLNYDLFINFFNKISYYFSKTNIFNNEFIKMCILLIYKSFKNFVIFCNVSCYHQLCLLPNSICSGKNQTDDFVNEECKKKRRKVEKIEFQIISPFGPSLRTFQRDYKGLESREN